CANSWIEDARYGTPAEHTLGFTSYGALAAAAYSLYLTMHAVNTTRKVQGVLSNSYWPAAAFASAGLLGAAFIGTLLAMRYRSKRLLLLSQAAMLVLYSAFLVILCGVAMRPTGVDPKLRDVACVKYGKSDQGSRLCKMLPGIERDLAEQMGGLVWAGGAAAVASLACLICSVWYLYELSYIERKAIKHKRRHKRRKHSIPWDKIKIARLAMDERQLRWRLAAAVLMVALAKLTGGAAATMPCPFGFTADDEDGDVSVSESGEDKPKEDEPETKGDGDEAPPAPATAVKGKGKKAKAKAGPLEFDFEKDPVSWFYQNQIKSEAEFATKKDALRVEARKRLDQIMSKKEKRVEWPSDSDFDELSIRSSELSDLDSDVNSLGSLI
ncbi:hypothetical protein TSOC_010441, partial [Tetrabaena socialis]